EKERQAYRNVTIDTQAQQRIADLEQKLAKYRQVADLMERTKREARFIDLGEQLSYRPLMAFNILGGSGYWQNFMQRASDETLLKAIATAEYFLEGLIVLRGDPREQRIAELESQVKDLQARLEAVKQVETPAPTPAAKK